MKIGNIKGSNGNDGANGSNGANGDSIELRVTSTQIQWKYTKDTSWTKLIDLSDLKGDDGDKGDKGDKGNKGDKGDKGDQGDPGINGTNFLTSNGVPASSLGKNGDTCLDYLNGDLYEKQSGAWKKISNIFGKKLTEAEEKFAENQNIVKEIANAYAFQENQIKYDQSMNRRQVTASPEDATSQNTIYLDCSSFVNAIYIEGFGTNILPYSLQEKKPQTEFFVEYAKDKADETVTNNGFTYKKQSGENPEVIAYYSRNHGNAYTQAEISNNLDFLAHIESLLEVGDVLCYRRYNNLTGSEKGHCWMYMGLNSSNAGHFVHCLGGDYALKENANLSHDVNYSPEGVEKVGTKHAFQQNTKLSNDDTYIDSSYYLFSRESSTKDNQTYLTDELISFCILRPLAKNLTKTYETKNRMNFRGFDLEKRVSEGLNTGIYQGDYINYSVIVTNKSTSDTKIKNFTFEDVIDDDLEFIGLTITSDPGVTFKYEDYYNTDTRKLTVEIFAV